VKAIVLAAGKGTRLGPLTEARPKPLLPLHGTPVLERTLALLRRHGVREVFMNLHHCPAAIPAHCGDGRAWGLRIAYAVEPELRGTAGAVKQFEAAIGREDFLVVYGDNYYDLDLAPLLRFHAGTAGVATVGLVEQADVAHSGIADLAPDGRLRRFVEKPGPGAVFSRWANAGLYACRPGLFAHIPVDRPTDFGRDIFPRLVAEGVPVFGLVLRGTVLGIDTPERYREAEAALAAAEAGR
jgi:NDP-sugar pyrophosphorylase family protein